MYKDVSIIGKCGLCKTDIYECEPHFDLTHDHLCWGCIPEMVDKYLKAEIGGYVPLYTIVAVVERYKRRKNCLPKAVRQEILRKYRFKCQNCGEQDFRKLSIDHIISYSKGGTDHPSNLTVLCKSCNSKKGIKIAEAPILST